MNYINRGILAMVSVFGLLACESATKNSIEEVKQQTPNILIIYADDLGYGDTGAYGATALKTPNIDALAAGGLRFTDAYASSATCTPSRFALLTGSYPWREQNAKILPGNAPLLIDTSQNTLPALLKTKGYYTGIVGKWHLGLGNGNVDWNQPITPGPNELGFDYSYILAATQDRVPTVYIQNGKVVGLDPKDPISVSYQENFPGEPTALDHPEMLKLNWDHGHNNSIVNGIPRIGFMKGGAAARWIDQDMADTFLHEAKQFVKDHKSTPFFLYYALQQPHVPRTPHSRFAGATELGPRGDAIAEADWCIGALMETLKEEGLLENTLVILSSDNGPVLNDGYEDEAVQRNGAHTPWGPLRGGKYSLFQAGTRVPFIVSWPGRVTPGVSHALVSQIDLMASLGELVGTTVKNTDSQNLLGTFLGNSKSGRRHLVLEAMGRTAFREGDWVLIPPYDGPAVQPNVQIELGNHTEYQLFNLNDDPGETTNLADKVPDKLQQMRLGYEKIIGKK